MSRLRDIARSGVADQSRRRARTRRSSPAVKVAGITSPRSAARRTRRATSPAVCRASPSCSRRVGRRIRRRSPRSTASCGSATSSAASARSSSTRRRSRRAVVADESAEPQLYEVPAGKHLRVHEGDRVRAGDRLSEGPVNPHDILRIKGPRAVQEYLLNEVQEVYRLQGVKINDKHIGVIVQPDAAEGARRRSGRHRVPRGRARRQADLPRRERAGPKQKERRRPRPSRCCSASRRRRSRRSRSSRRRPSRRPRACSPTRRSAARKDDLLGLKENIIIGHLIPAGTGMYRYAEIEMEPPAGFEPPPPPVEEVAAAPRRGRWSVPWPTTTCSRYGRTTRRRPGAIPGAFVVSVMSTAQRSMTRVVLPRLSVTMIGRPHVEFVQPVGRGAHAQRRRDATVRCRDRSARR